VILFLISFKSFSENAQPICIDLSPTYDLSFSNGTSNTFIAVKIHELTPAVLSWITEITADKLAIIVSGGYTNMNSSVEILDENGNYWCSLPKLPDYRESHTQSGLITCGGNINDVDDSIRDYVNTDGVQDSCLTFSSGQWIKSHNLRFRHKQIFDSGAQRTNWYRKRSRHSSWISPQGVVLMGGEPSLLLGKSTLVLMDDGQVKLGFGLRQAVYFACTIQLDEQVILTGGNYDEKRVDVYNMDGWVKGLPRLGTGRYKHGCGHYIDSNDRMVYLVTGGTDGITGALTSTEILVSGAESWTEVAGQLPKPLMGLSGVSLNNKIFMTGGYSKGPWDYILQFNPDNGTWSNIGKMKQARSFHGASLVNVDDVIDYCN